MQKNISSLKQQIGLARIKENKVDKCEFIDSPIEIKNRKNIPKSRNNDDFRSYRKQLMTTQNLNMKLTSQKKRKFLPLPKNNLQKQEEDAKKCFINISDVQNIPLIEKDWKNQVAENIYEEDSLEESFQKKCKDTEE